MAKQVIQSKQPLKSRPNQRGQSKLAKKKSLWDFPFTKQNLIIALIGFGVILIGYALMATGITNTQSVVDGKWNNPLAVTVAPFVLVIGYCIIIPYAIMKYFGNKKESNENTNL